MLSSRGVSDVILGFLLRFPCFSLVSPCQTSTIVYGHLTSSNVIYGILWEHPILVHPPRHRGQSSRAPEPAILDLCQLNLGPPLCSKVFPRMAVLHCFLGPETVGKAIGKPYSSLSPSLFPYYSSILLSNATFFSQPAAFLGMKYEDLPNIAKHCHQLNWPAESRTPWFLALDRGRRVLGGWTIESHQCRQRWCLLGQVNACSHAKISTSFRRECQIPQSSSISNVSSFDVSSSCIVGILPITSNFSLAYPPVIMAIKKQLSPFSSMIFPVFYSSTS